MFLSHSRKDAAAAERLCAVLEAAGIMCWIAPRDIPPGHPWPASIATAIASARLVAVLVSDAGNASAEVARETIAALDARRPLLTVRLHDVAPAGNLAFLLAGVQWYDAFARVGAEAGVVDVVRPLLDNEQTATAVVAHPPARRPSPSNLPVTVTRLIGRDADVQRLAALLADHRVVTLTGSGGVGKTRLAIAAVSAVRDRWNDGCSFVDLAPLADAPRVAETIAAVLGIPEATPGDVLDAIERTLHERSHVLILDNCEHVVGEVARIVHALARRTAGSIVATSREPLRVDGEVVYRVPSLELEAAVALFAERATAANHTFRLSDDNREQIASIARAIDGIPFAIELAAARIRAMTPSDIERRLVQRFRLLTGGNRTSLPRQQTLSAMIDWSHDLLTDDERRVFRRLAVFAGGWTLDAAAGVCADEQQSDWDVADRLASLVDKSLVVHDAGTGDARFRFLETTRAYAAERLDEAGERDAIEHRHLAWYLDLAADGDRTWTTLPPDRWRARFLPDLENQRAALAIVIDRRAGEGTGLRLAAALRPLWTATGRPAEGVAWCERALAAAGDDGSLPVAAVLLAIGRLLQYGIHVRRRRSAATRAAEICRSLGDERGLIRALQDIAFADVETGDRQAADATAINALELARALGDATVVMNCLQTRSFTIDPGRLDDRRALLEEAHAIAVRSHNERDGAALSMWLADFEADRGDYVAARRRGYEALVKLIALGENVQAAFCSANLCAYALDAGDATSAAADLAEALRLADGNVPLVTAIAGQYAAEIAMLRGDAVGAARAKGFSDARLAELDVARGATEERSLRRLETALRDSVEARDLERMLAEGASLDESAALSFGSPPPRRPSIENTALDVR